MTTISKEKLSQIGQEMEQAPVKAAKTATIVDIQPAPAKAAPAPCAEVVSDRPSTLPALIPNPKPRVRVMDLVWKRRTMSIKGDLVADTPIGRITIAMALLPSKTPFILQMPTMGDHSFRPVPCETVEKAQELARSEIEALVRSLTVSEIDPATADAR